MKIHQIVDDSTLQVVSYLVDNHLPAHVDQLHICEILLVFVNGLIHLFVVADPIPKIPGGNFGVLTLVVRRGGLDLQDVAHDDIFIVAFGFDVQGLDVVGFAALVDPPSTVFG